MARALVVQQIALDDLRPYPNNPRDNRSAIEAVKQSIHDFDFLIPIVVDEKNVIIAGHTRVTAMKQLRAENPEDERYFTVPAVVAKHLSKDQADAFRMIDNKTASLAVWDFDLLSGEIAALASSGIDFTKFGWTQEEVDCLSNVVNADCLTDDGVFGAANQGRQLSAHRDGQSVRISIADLAFYVLREDYDKWADELRRQHGYDLDKMLDWLAERMGLGPAKARRIKLLEEGKADEHADEVFDEKEDA